VVQSLSLKIKMRYNPNGSVDFLLCWACREFSHSLALQRLTAASRSCPNRRVSWPPSLSLGRSGGMPRPCSMKTLVRSLSPVLLVLFVSCATVQHKAIVGRWQEVGTSMVGVFHEDGTVELTGGQTQASGSYSFIGSGKLKIQLARSDTSPARPHVYDVVISGDQMSWTDIDGTRSEYRRVK